MTNEKLYNVAIVGATGAVGEQLLHILEKRNFPIQQLHLLASARSAGQERTFKGQKITIQEAKPESFEGIDIAFFSAGGGVSKKLAPEAAKRGALAIDNTNAFRMDPEVPLVVPEVNEEDIAWQKGIISNPNCSTIQMVVALKPLQDKYGLRRIIASTYQAVSGAGHSAIQELEKQSKDALEGQEVVPDILPVSSLDKKHQMAFNVVPQIDVFQENGFTLEEMKMVNETKKIMHDNQIEVDVTCVRVPVITGHSESVYVELDNEANVNEVRELLANASGVIVQDDPSEQVYPLATDSAGRNEVFVGRIRQGLNNTQSLHLWIVSDNLLKGAAWNSVQIAESYISKYRQ